MSRVLVVDDVPDARALARLILEQAQHDVAEASTGEEALEVLARDPRFDVVLLDIRMPGLSGWEVLAQLRADHRLNGMSVILFSAHVEPGNLQRALSAGAAAYLEKPYRLDELVETIDAIAS